MTGILRYADLTANFLVTQSEYTYDHASRLTNLKHYKPGVYTNNNYTFTYDDASRITQINSYKEGLTTYSYDNDNQLRTADYASQADETITYDENGNRETVNSTPYATDPHSNRLLSDGTNTYTYDAEGNRTSHTGAARRPIRSRT